jgi:DNA ligase (NAD+)
MGRGANNQLLDSNQASQDIHLKQQFNELEKELSKHKDLYYNGQPEISDAEFDALEEQLKQLTESHPNLASQQTALNQVGAPVDALFGKVPHEQEMLSLDKVHTEEDISKWVKGLDGEKLSMWPKFDGVSLSLIYKQGKLVQAASRGDGKVGDNLTQHAVNIIGVQSSLNELIDCEIRGEVVMHKSDWEEYNKNNPGNTFANPRNAVAGTLRLKDPEEAKKRPLHFYAFDIISDQEDQSTEQQLSHLNFNVARYQEATDVDQVLDYVRQTDQDRQGLDYEIDGIVLKISDPEKYRDLGNTSKHPRGAMAMKLAADIGETEFVGVEWGVGKSGIIAPRAKINPLFLAGTTINWATLHNVEEIKRRGLRVGQRIKIKRAGDVIPFVIGPADGQESAGQEISIPTNCPSCATVLIEVGNSNSGVLQCPNTSKCPEQKSKRLEHWASREAADIDGLSSGILKKLENAGKIDKPSDIYKLQASDISGLEGMGEKSANKLIASINNKKDLGLRNAFIAWTIPNASQGTAKRLCLAGYNSPEELIDASAEDLAKIEDIGPTTATSIKKFFDNPDIQQEIKELRSAGVNLDTKPEDKPVVLEKDTAFTGKKVCLTGSLSVSRGEFKKLLEKVGAKVSSSVSKNTDYLVAGAEAGSKLTKAQDLGVKVLDESTARSML